MENKIQKIIVKQKLSNFIIIINIEIEKKI